MHAFEYLLNIFGGFEVLPLTARFGNISYDVSIPGLVLRPPSSTVSPGQELAGLGTSK